MYMITILKEKLKKTINNCFVNDTGLVAKGIIYQYEGKPFAGYVIYQTYKFFWITQYKTIDHIDSLETLKEEYPNIKVIY